MNVKQLFQAEDGKIFDTEYEAKEHNKSLVSKEESDFNNFLNSYSGKRLLEENNLTDVGVWKISGEDPNCDFGGHHHNPYIATVQGTLEETIRYAVKQPRWFTWGRGGEINRVEVINLITKKSNLITNNSDHYDF